MLHSKVASLAVQADYIEAARAAPHFVFHKPKLGSGQEFALLARINCGDSAAIKGTASGLDFHENYLAVFFANQIELKMAMPPVSGKYCIAAPSHECGGYVFAICAKSKVRGSGFSAFHLPLRET